MSVAEQVKGTLSSVTAEKNRPTERTYACLENENINGGFETSLIAIEVPSTPITTADAKPFVNLPTAPIIEHIASAVPPSPPYLQTSTLVLAAINAFEVEVQRKKSQTTVSEVVQSTLVDAANAIASAVAFATGKKTENIEKGTSFFKAVAAQNIAQETVEAIRNVTAKLAANHTASAIASVAVPTVASANMQPFSSLALMREYDFDNTLNTIKENGVNLMEKDIEPSCDMENSSGATTVKANEKHASTETQTNGNDNNEPNPCDKEKYTEKDINSKHPRPHTPNMPNAARKRWKILAHVLRNNSEESIDSSQESLEDHQLASVRRFKTFDLLRQDSFEDHTALNSLSKCDNWFKYHVTLHEHAQQDYWVNIHHLERPITAICLMGFNNTGNVCIWPSEEALTVYVLSDLTAYRDKWILELGGGFTCLSGLMLSKYAQPYAVHLTDGNEMSVENVKKTLALNELSGYTKCSVLKWQDKNVRAANEREKFNFILSADCLFFDEARAALVDTIDYYLEPENGVGLIMAPKRGKTMGLFIKECNAHGFRVETIKRYNENIWQRHLKLKENSDLYDEDLHYPVLLRLQKINKHVNNAESLNAVTAMGNVGAKN